MDGWAISSCSMVRSISVSSGSWSDEAASSTSSCGRGGRRTSARLERGGEAVAFCCWVDGFGFAREKRGVGANCDAEGGRFGRDEYCGVMLAAGAGVGS